MWLIVDVGRIPSESTMKQIQNTDVDFGDFNLLTSHSHEIHLYKLNITFHMVNKHDPCFIFIITHWYRHVFNLISFTTEEYFIITLCNAIYPSHTSRS